MANPGGGNQFGNYTLQPAYGDVKKQTQLTRSAPMSGAPFASQALGAPRREGRQAVGARSAPKGQPQQQPQPQATPPPPSVAATWQAISRIPGISPLAHEYAADALSIR